MLSVGKVDLFIMIVGWNQIYLLWLSVEESCLLTPILSFIFLQYIINTLKVSILLLCTKKICRLTDVLMF